MRLINLGCGKSFHPDWINFDCSPVHPSIVRWDVRSGIPEDDTSCEAVYASHIVEHLRRSEAGDLMRECYRILKPGGIIRVVVPDLEVICRMYLQVLEEAVAGERNASEKYDWMILELYDQFVREEPGGEMAKYLQRGLLPNHEFIVSRIGENATNFNDAGTGGTAPTSSVPRAQTWIRSMAGAVRQKLLSLFLRPSEKQVLKIAKFRYSGELHYWMYDRFSLAQLLLRSGFQEPVKRDAKESSIPGWQDFHLDILENGTVRKPDSLFMEAIRKSY